jgi:hypothetical protein
MSALRDRLSAAIKGYGETVASSTGIVVSLSREMAESYLTDAEVAAAAMPVYAAYVRYDDATSLAATVSWNGLSLTVKRIVPVRLKGETLAKVLVMV